MQSKNNIPVISRSGLQLASAADNYLFLINQLLDEGNPEYWYEKAIKAKEEENWEEAFYFISKAIRLNNKESKHWVEKSLLSVKIQRAETAADCLAQALKNRESWTSFCSNLNQCEWREIKLYFQNINSSDYKFTFSKAVLELIFENAEVSLEILNSINEELIEDVNFFDLRALANFDIQDYESIKEDYSKVLSLCPNNAIAYYNRARAKFELEEFSIVNHDLEKAIELNKTYYSAYYLRGVVNEKLEKLEEALKDFTTCIILAPEKYYGYFRRGGIYLELDKNIEAIKDYNKALEIDSFSSDSYCNRGHAKYYLNDFKGAINDYSSAIELIPNDADCYYWRGDCKLEEKNYLGAIEDFDQAIKLNPELNDVYSSRNLALKKLEEA